MQIEKAAVAGTLESSDVQITIRPNEGNGIRIELDSVVKTIFGDEIIRTVQEVLNEFEEGTLISAWWTRGRSIA